MCLPSFQKYILNFVMMVSVLALVACGGGGGGENGNGGNGSGCDAVGQRFADALERIPSNQGICAIYRGQLDVYLRFRQHANCFEGGLRTLDNQIAQLRQGVNNSCSNTGSGKFGAVSYTIPDCNRPVVGLAFDQPNSSIARSNAIDDCQSRGGGFDCIVTVREVEYCVAVAFGRTSSQCTQFVSRSKYSASQNALAGCRQEPFIDQSSCHILRSGCNSR